MYHTVQMAPVPYLINDEVNGRGLNQFQYDVEGDHYYWHYQNDVPSCLNGDCHTCDLSGAKVKLRFAGMRICLNGLIGPDQGVACFYIDEKLVEQKDLYHPRTQCTEIFHADGLSEGEHLLTVMVSGEKNELSSRCGVTIDCAYVWQTCAAVDYPLDEVVQRGDAALVKDGVMAIPANQAVRLRARGMAFLPLCLEERRVRISSDDVWMKPMTDGWFAAEDASQRHHNLCLFASEAASMSGIRALCALEVTDYRAILRQTAGIRVCYEGAWGRQPGAADAANGNAYETQDADALALIVFEGSQLTVYGQWTGEIYALLDGERLEDLQFRPVEGVLLRTSFLASGEHELVLKKRGAGMLRMEGFSLARFMPAKGAVIMDVAKTFQTIQGFGASSGWTIEPVCSTWREENKERLADLLYDRQKGIGLNCFRFDLGAGSRISDTERICGADLWRATEVFKAGEDQPYDFSRQEGQTWMMQAAKKRGADLFFAYIHSAPFWMNKNGHTQCDPDTGSTNLMSGYEDRLVAFLLDVVEHFRLEKGLPFDYLSPINEPGWSWEYPGVHEEGCRMSKHDILSLLRSAARMIKQRHVPIKLLAPEMETVQALEEILPFLKEDSQVWEGMGGDVSAHSYFSDMFDRTGVNTRISLAQALLKSGAERYWQTEYCLMGTGRGEGRDLGMTPALWIAQTIHYDLTLLNACSWQWWLSLSPGDFTWKDGLVYSDWRKPGDEENVQASKMLWALGHFSRFIKRGDQRVECSVDAGEDLLASAYINVQGDRRTLVLLNLSGVEQVLKIPQAQQTEIYLTDEHEGVDILRKDELLLSKTMLAIPPQCILTVQLLGDM